jgi:hypothetical protein
LYSGLKIFALCPADPIQELMTAAGEVCPRAMFSALAENKIPNDLNILEGEPYVGESCPK